uniref:Ig-like domain-containing protein n=1 Tax=Neogobius melanostomus TaxID=47308 RepID=A0A8C6SNX7_9GOBI
TSNRYFPVYTLSVLSPPVGAEEWKASVVSSMDALVDSCVVVPCSFSHPKETLPTARLRGQWHRTNDRDQLIYYKDETRVLENFRGRTQLLGELGKGNCSLEITDIKSHDNGPFCFRIELARTETDTQTKDKFSFVEDCVTLRMMSEPNAPSLTHKDPIQGRPFTITCSVMHTCPTNKPEITWSRGSADDVTESHREIQRGLWEISSVLTFIPAEKDSHQDVTCTVLFQGRKTITSSSKMTLYVRRSENYNYIIIPVVVALGSAAIFGGLCFLMVKKYNLFNRLSRISRR